MKCTPEQNVHVFSSSTWGGTAWCDGGHKRNPAYKRRLWQKLFGLPKKPEETS